jgi:hypothetical protein
MVRYKRHKNLVLPLWFQNLSASFTTFKYFKIPPALPLDLPTLLCLDLIFDTANPIPSALDDDTDILFNISNNPSVESSETIDKLHDAQFCVPIFIFKGVAGLSL